MTVYGRSQQGSIKRGLAKNNGCFSTAIILIIILISLLWQLNRN